MTTKQDEFLTAINEQLRQCTGFDGDKTARAREDAQDYYFQRPRGDEVAGRSAVVSGDLSAMVEANLAAMVDAFSTTRIAEFDPMGPEDEDQAQLESDAVQYFVMQRSNGTLQLVTAIKDALMLRNGVCKVYVTDEKQARTRHLLNVTPEAIASIKEDDDVTVVKFDEKTGEATIRTVAEYRKFNFQAVPLENFLYTADWDKLEVQDIPFCAERHITTRSELLGRFPDKKKEIEALTAHSIDYNVAKAARKPKKYNNYRSGVDASQDPIEYFEAYVLADRDGDGISERRKVCFYQHTLLEDIAVNLVPYAVGTAIINGHQLEGVSLFDKLKQVQDLNTGLQRALMDNVNTTNKNKVAYLDGRVNVDDVSDGRTNGAIRVKANVADVRQAVMPFAVPDTSANILQNIEYQNRIRSELGGAALDMQGAQLQIGGEGMGSQGLDRAYSVAEQLASYFTKTIALTLIRSTFLLAHETMRENFAEPTNIKVNGNWVQANPAQWVKRESVTIKPGMSTGERQRKATALATVLQSQIQLAEKGMDGVLVDLEGYYRTLMDWMRISDIQNPEQYFVDPASEKSQQAAQGKQEAAAQEQQMKQKLMQEALGQEHTKIGLDKYKHDSDLQFKYYDANLDAEVDEAKIAGDAAIQFLKDEDQGGDVE